MNYKRIILSTAATSLGMKKAELKSCLKLYSVEGVIVLEITDLTLAIMPQPYNSRTNFRY